VEHVHHRSNGGPHLATLFAIATIVLGVAVSLVGFFAKADRDDIKASAALAVMKSNSHDTEIALLKQSLARLEADTAEIKKGQGEILARLPPKR
jgi:hypothetical protein